MGTYVTAEIVYGIVIDDDDLERILEAPEDDEEWGDLEYAFFESLREDFPLLEVGYAGDLEWDETPRYLSIRNAGVTSYSSILEFDPMQLGVEIEASLQLSKAITRLGLTENPSWMLVWSRG